MRFNCGKSLRDRRCARKGALMRWHSWYAWRPVRFNYIEGGCVWLETIERKSTYGGIEYRPTYNDV